MVVNTAFCSWLGDLPAETKKPPGLAACRIFDLQSSDRAQSSRRQRAAKVPIGGGQVDHAAHIVDAKAVVTCLMTLRIVPVSDVILALGKPDTAPKPVGPTQIGYHVILIEIVHILDDLDADCFFGWEGKREQLQRVAFRPRSDANAKMTAYRDPIWMH
ncbi:hypothetical protein [Mesorhizobium sp. GbtcB19]|uniref:hypothetical protein n=1 Tax=Mesorhizobium sp. GbtcB19 TaxID=2824764 RepID=UPI001C310EEF|nr:hypothetical protein [Mesorhizobium sp. GbtcB19]